MDPTTTLYSLAGIVMTTLAGVVVVLWRMYVGETTRLNKAVFDTQEAMAKRIIDNDLGWQKRYDDLINTLRG